MKRLFYAVALIILPLFLRAKIDRYPLYSLDTTGVQFIKGLSWQEILNKAKKEGKFIFLDCYATWCTPCKKMDQDVYSKEAVGHFMNAQFISLRVQMDTSEKDDEYTKKWYADAAALKRKYRVKIFPSYLFFSPDGNIVHKYSCALSDTDFLKVVKNALIPEKQYYSLLNKYKSNIIDKSDMGYLAIVCKKIGENNLANKIAKEYLYNYLNKLAKNNLILKRHFDFVKIFPYLISSKDNIFKVMYKNGSEVDKLVGEKGFAQIYVAGVITNEEINPTLLLDKKGIISPKWNQLTTLIQKKYNKWWADKLVLDAQLKWYEQKKDMYQIIKYRVKQIDNYGIDTAGIGWALVNNFVWNYVFEYCNNKDTLNKATKWMELIIQNHPEDCESLDTYANVLYKIGRKTEAIKWEIKAVELDTEAASKEKRNVNSIYGETLEKMKRDVPTWSSK
jgi:thioredoxin-related protein